MQSTTPTALGRDARVNRFILTLLTIGFAALLGGMAAALWTQQRNTDGERWVAHTLEVQTHIGAFASKAERMETARRGRLLSQDPGFDRLFDEALAGAMSDLAKLQQMTADNPRQGANIAHMRKLLQDYVGEHRAERSDASATQIVLRKNFFNDPVVLYIRQIRQVADAMADEERGLLQQREAAQTQNLRTFNLVLVAIALLILAVATATILLVRRTLRELRASRLELSALNTDLERLVDSRTTELQRANAEIQRFAYIVSHDLRSPLVNVMGFTAELEAATKVIARSLDDPAQPGATVPSPEDVRRAVGEDLPEAIGFIRSSTQKMDRLINAILRLSREGRRTLAPEPLDLNTLVRSIADSMQHRLTETETALTIAPLPMLTSDRTAVEQILSNLMENALKYLQPGRKGEIHITGKVARGRAIIEVSDNGRGIDPRDHERIFDLFRRSGVQDQPGEGIGLAHVRALAYRLGGVIEVVSELGQGATFRVNLPVEWKGAENNG